VGESREASAWIARLDLFVLPSRQEALPYVILEAAAWKKPVVASAVGGIRELIRPEESGLLVPPGDPKRLSEALVRLAQDPELRVRLGRRLHADLSGEYTLDRMLRQTRDLYLRLYRRKTGGTPGHRA
jgi:glycosyltransferase involved in cell wall biosynthesis